MPLTRSEQMSRIRGKDTSPELRLRTALAPVVELAAPDLANTILGRPDLYIPATRTAVFIDGCFWHGCPEHYVRPRSRGEFWSAKLASNVERDHRQTVALEADGYRVARVWEHEVFETLDAVVAGLVAPSAAPPPGPHWSVALVEVIDGVNNVERRHLVDLRDPDVRSFRDGPRSTRKWPTPK